MGSCRHAIIRNFHGVLGDVWNAHDANAVDRFTADDIVVEAGGHKIAGKDNVLIRYGVDTLATTV